MLMLANFNEIMSSKEHKVGSRVNFSRCIQFDNWINDCHTMEVTIVGSKFTWKGPRWEGRDCIVKSLMAFCNVE